MCIPAVTFLNAGSFYINNRRTGGKQVSQRVFKSHFRLSPQACSDLWHRLVCHTQPDMVQRDVTFSSVKGTTHLLWVLHYAFVYSSEDVVSSFFGVTPKTFRKYVWAMFTFLNKMSPKIVSRN